MRRLLILLLAALPVLAAAQTPQLDYIAKYSALAVSEMQRTGVPASITLAQGLVESGAGLSPLAVHANNHFGMKCHNDWDGETFYKDDDTAQECFRAFRTAEESFKAHSDFLRNRPRYASLFELEPTDYKGWARGLKKAGYATDPAYAAKLIKQIEDFQLDRFDRLEEAGATDGPKTETKSEPEPQPEPELKQPEETAFNEEIVLPI